MRSLRWSLVFGGPAYFVAFRADGSVIPDLPGDFTAGHLRKSKVDEAVARAALPPQVSDALKEAWPSVAHVEVSVYRGRTHLSCDVYDSRVADPLVTRLRAAGGEVDYHPDSRLLSAWWTPTIS